MHGFLGPENFYDSLGLCLLALLALCLGLPPDILYNCFFYCFGARALVSEDCYSEAILLDAGM